MHPIVELDSRDFSPAQRAVAFRDVAAQMCLLDVTPDPDIEFASTIRLYLLPDLQISRTTWTASTTVRTSSHTYATGDHVIFHFPLTGQFSIRQTGGEECICRPGEVYVDPTAERGIDIFQSPRTDLIYLSTPRARLKDLCPQLSSRFRQKQKLTGPWKLLLSYVQTLTDPALQLSDREHSQCSQHLVDLLAMSLNRPADMPIQRVETGVKAARLRALKQFIDERLSEPGLSPDALANHFRISPRYLRALFATENTSFRDYVLTQRLARAFERLETDPDPFLRISEVAYSVGFNDLSWFNNGFKRRYGITPSDVRRNGLSSA